MPALLAAGLVAALVYLVWVGRGASAGRSVLKTVPLAAFALWAWLADAPGLLVVALVLSALGDLALSRPGERAFLAGLVAFAFAHVAYVVLFSMLAGAWPWYAFARAPGVAAVLVA
ncbi:MAG TPA: lysoplasmalogenase, partial [Aliiroseovarius sp.]|nr:lysoplasmalogenase [Aliiroseovarius sp.]